MGQPPRWEPHLAAFQLRSDAPAWQTLVSVGMHRPITHPVVGLFGLTGEAYARVDHGIDPGLRALATSRAIGLSAGIDWDGDRRLATMLSFQAAIRRGGLLGRGTMLRVDWLPAHEDVAIGLTVPVAQRFAGRTRCRDTEVDEAMAADRRTPFIGTIPASAETAMQQVARSATMILAYTNLFAEDTARVRFGDSYTTATRSYREALEEAFRIAANNITLGEGIAHRARTGLLDHVILPYDSLFGQVKQHASGIRTLTATAHARFLDWLRDSSRVAPRMQAAVATVHGRWLGVIEAVHANLLHQWRDSRLVWLPLQLALTEDQYDEQAEVDALLERAVGRPFTDQNALTYLRSSDLPLEIARSIFATRDYHVLWVHDFAGQRDETKAMDEMSFTMVADAYLPALTRAVQQYDSVGKMPAYMIMIDEFFYAQRNGRLWMTILENPLESELRLPGSNAARVAHLKARQRELRSAVAASRTIPAGLVKVHVNVLHPHDFSFRSHRIVPPLPFVPDNVMRDHRKLVLYDVTESDPYRGATIVMGVGVGEHYSTATWEDRGFRIRGPAALEARAGLRRAWLANGLKLSDLPRALQADDRQPQKRQTDYVGRALQVHNDVGFAPKESSIARAMLYNLAPAGSVIIVPDPLWVSETWASMLAGAAARGAKVYLIAPAAANSPNPVAAVHFMEHSVMSRMLEIRRRLADQLQRAGGELRVGLYTSKTHVTDAPGRIAEVREGLRRAPWIREVIPFDNATLAALDRGVLQTQSDGRDATDLAQDETPRLPALHQKTQLIARPGAIQTLVRQPGWEDVLASAMRVQSQQSAKFADQMTWTTPDIDSAATREVDARLRGYEQSLSDADRKAFSFYFSLGTQNQDPRGLMLDGEATLIVSGLHAAAGLVDLYYLMARSTWIETTQELDRLIPKPTGFMARIYRMIRYAL
jgi:hypothetical protein